MAIYLKENGGITCEYKKGMEDRQLYSAKDFIEAVEAQDTWDGTDPKAYAEALSAYGLDFASYDDAEEAWDSFTEAVEKQGDKQL